MDCWSAEAETIPSQVQRTVVPSVEQVTIMSRILRNVDPLSVVCTDSALAYTNLADRYVHCMIDHSVRYVDGKVHTNGIEKLLVAQSNA